MKSFSHQTQILTMGFLTFPSQRWWQHCRNYNENNVMVRIRNMPHN